MRHRSPLLGLVLAAAALLTGTVSATIINVPGDYPTITAALAVAYPLDEVRVAPGTYFEPELLLPPGVDLVGTGDRPDEVVLDGQDAHRVLTVLGTESFVQNLKIVGGRGTQGGGVAIRAGAVELRDLEITDCRANLGGGIFIEADAAVIERCHIIGCAAETGGGGIYAFSTDQVEVRDSVIYDNHAGAYGGAWYGARSELVLQGCTVLGNRAAIGGEGAAFHGFGVSVEATIAVDNVPDEGFVGTESLLVGDLADRVEHGCSLRWEPGWPGYLAAQLADAGRHNLEADPLFCFEPDGSLEDFLGLAANSPALAANNPDCGLIGAFGEACGPTAAPEIPGARCTLHPAYPNPFNPITHLHYEIARTGPVQLVIYSLDGRRVATLVDEGQAAGAHTATWAGLDDRGRSVASGVYIGRLVADDTSAAVRLTLVK